jgi:hypothetical protein
MVKYIFFYLIFLVSSFACAYELKFISTEFLVVPKATIGNIEKENVHVKWDKHDLVIPRKSLFNHNVTSGGPLFVKSKDFIEILKKSDTKFSLEKLVKNCQLEGGVGPAVANQKNKFNVINGLRCDEIAIPVVRNEQSVICDSKTNECRAFVSYKLAEMNR